MNSADAWCLLFPGRIASPYRSASRRLSRSMRMSVGTYTKTIKSNTDTSSSYQPVTEPLSTHWGLLFKSRSIRAA